MDVLSFAQEVMPCESSDATATDDSLPVSSPTAAPVSDSNCSIVSTSEWITIVVVSAVAGVALGVIMLASLQHLGIVCASKGIKWVTSDDKIVLREEHMNNVVEDTHNSL
jgi:hypothetical protein